MGALDREPCARHGKNWCRPCDREHEAERAKRGVGIAEQGIDYRVGRTIRAASYHARNQGEMVIVSRYNDRCGVCGEHWSPGTRIRRMRGDLSKRAKRHDSMMGRWVHEECWSEDGWKLVPVWVQERRANWVDRT